MAGGMDGVGERTVHICAASEGELIRGDDGSADEVGERVSEGGGVLTVAEQVLRERDAPVSAGKMPALLSVVIRSAVIFDGLGAFFELFAVPDRAFAGVGGEFEVLGQFEGVGGAGVFA